MSHMVTANTALTPYDTGARLEPQLWQTFDEPAAYGRVDFDDEEGRTVLTLHVERREAGYVLVVDSSAEPLLIQANSAEGEASS